MFDGDESPYIAEVPDINREGQRQAPRQQNQPKTAFQFNEAATIDVKGYKIDLSRVKEVKKAQTIHNGKNSFGIEFLFVGAKGLGRTIWYGTNFHQRDTEFDSYSALWAKVKQ